MMAAVSSQGFYDEVSSPLLLDVDLRYPENAVGLLTKNHFNQLFNGSEIVVAGQMDLDRVNENFIVEVLAKGVRIKQTRLCRWFERAASGGGRFCTLHKHVRGEGRRRRFFAAGHSAAKGVLSAVFVSLALPALLRCRWCLISPCSPSLRRTS